MLPWRAADPTTSRDGQGRDRRTPTSAYAPFRRQSWPASRPTVPAGRSSRGSTARPLPSVPTLILEDRPTCARSPTPVGPAIGVDARRHRRPFGARHRPSSCAVQAVRRSSRNAAAAVRRIDANEFAPVDKAPTGLATVRAGRARCSRRRSARRRCRPVPPVPREVSVRHCRAGGRGRGALDPLVRHTEDDIEIGRLRLRQRPIGPGIYRSAPPEIDVREHLRHLQRGLHGLDPLLVDRHGQRNARRPPRFRAPRVGARGAVRNAGLTAALARR